MKRLMFVVLAALLLVQAVVAAQTGHQAVTDAMAGDFGEGWASKYTDAPVFPDQDWNRRLVFLGPSGSRVVVMTYTIGSSISERARDWLALKQTLPTYAGQPALMADTNEDLGKVDPETIPDSVSDTYRSSYPDFYGEPFAFGLYAFRDSSTAIIVIVEGTVNGLTGVAATDYVAGLYFAALSGQ